MKDFLNNNKYVSFLFFSLPLFILIFYNIFVGPDFWFLISHGRYVINHGIPHTDFLSMHSNLHFVMQQWLSATIFYLLYHYLGRFGIMFLCLTMTSLYLFVIYKICMLLSDKKFLLSTILSVFTVILLELNFIIVRPQLFTYLFLLITLYIMEYFYKNKNSKIIYFMPLISLLQINFHSALFFMIYIFMLPYLFCYFLDFIKNKDKTIFKVLLIMIIMFLVALINPYKLEAITYIFKSYGRSDFKDFIVELFPTTLSKFTVISYSFYFVFFSVILIYIYYKKGELKLRHLLLFLGTSILGFLNVRNIAFFFIGTVPFISSYIKYPFKSKYEDNFKEAYVFYIILFVALTVAFCFTPKNNTSNLKDGIDYLLKVNKDKNVKIYAGFNYGSYLEYRGLHPYIDSRAEVYFSSINKKFDYFSEYKQLCDGYIEPKDFLDKYKFKYLVVNKGERLTKYLIQSGQYTSIYEGDEYIIFEDKPLVMNIFKN